MLARFLNDHTARLVDAETARLTSRRSPNTAKFRELAAQRSCESLRTLVNIHLDRHAHPLARVKAAEIITERAHGKAVQTVVHANALSEKTDGELLAEIEELVNESGVHSDSQTDAVVTIDNVGDRRNLPYRPPGLSWASAQSIASCPSRVCAIARTHARGRDRPAHTAHRQTHVCRSV